MEDGALVESATAALLNALGDNNEMLFFIQLKMNAKTKTFFLYLYCCMMNVAS